MLDAIKRFDRTLRDASASRLELRQVRANFQASLDEQMYRRREAERHLIEATVRLRALLPAQEGIELDHARSAHEAAVMAARRFLAGLEQ